MKHLLLTTIAVVMLVGCGESQPPETLTAKAPDIDIHEAVGRGNIEAVKQHLAAGADVNAKDENGWTPLHYAANIGYKEIAELLIANGADVNAQSEDKSTALHTAAYWGQKEVAELLIGKGADVNAKDEDGWIPLHRAAYYGRTEIAELLIAEGADVNAKTNNGQTPLDLATDPNNQNDTAETAELLREHGGKTGEELKAMMPQLGFIRSPFGFTFNTIEGKTYRVESGMDLIKWNSLRDILGTGSEVKFIDVRRIYFPYHFYRVKVVD